jgi:cobalt-precorrin 5A hydrolase
MKFAIITVTEEGKQVANVLYKSLEKDPTVIKMDMFHKNVKNTLSTIINRYDCIIGVMATGIMVRSLCPLLKSKFDDPAVLIVGEDGKHVISLLSGHMGGANNFARKLAGILDAVPVITTATDLQGKMGIDELAQHYWLKITDPGLIMDLNKFMAAGSRPDLFLPLKYIFLETHPQIIRSYNIQRWDKSFIRASFPGACLALYPKKLVAGLGSKKDVSTDQVLNALRSALQDLNLPIERLDVLATGEMKKDEPGIVDAASHLALNLEIISLKALKEFTHTECSTSQLVESKFGVRGVSEPSALIAAGKNSHLIRKKTALNGVTVAIAITE